MSPALPFEITTGRLLVRLIIARFARIGLFILTVDLFPFTARIRRWLPVYIPRHLALSAAWAIVTPARARLSFAFSAEKNFTLIWFVTHAARPF